MGTGRERRQFWGAVAPVVPAAMIAEVARQQEEMGLRGTFAPQVYGPPWIPLAVAASSTTRLELGSGVAQAFVRSPFETAMAALDLDRISNGRFVLGLGPSLQAWSEGIYGVPGYEKPLSRLREMVEVVRLTMAKSHTGELRRFEGTYYRFDWSEFQGGLPPLRTDIPIWLSALRGPAIEQAAEIGDGLIGHPIWSVEWVTGTVPRHLRNGLARAGKHRCDFHVNLWFWATPNADAGESLEDARAVTAFYAGMEQYQSYYEAHGFGKEARQLQAFVRRGDYRGGAHLVPDEMARAFVLTGTPDEVRRRIEPVWDVADSVLVAPPGLTLPLDKVAYYLTTIAETFY